MIGFLTGKLHSKDDTKAIIDVNGVGYQVFLAKDTLMTLGDIGSTLKFEIHTHINESAFQLYGFRSLQEKQFFQKLISVSGVGPKLALTMLSAMPVQKLMQALCDGNLATLTSISGVGKKTAERIIVELKDKFKDENLIPFPETNIDTKEDYRIRDVTSALLSLGYPETHARKIVHGLELTENDTVQSLIKQSLMRIQN